MSLQSGNGALQRCTTTFKVTVFRSRKTKQVLFLEAGKDFVDTLLNFLVLPMGTIINLLSQGIQVKPLGGISCIFESLDSSFLHVDKNHLVQSRPAVVGCTCRPTASVQFQQELVAAKMMQPSQYVSPELIYKCIGCVHYSYCRGTSCGTCKLSYAYSDGPYSVKRHNDPTFNVEGFVKGNVNFIVTDKLEVIPSTINSAMSLLKKLEVTSVDDPESDEITVSITQIVELLHSALISKKCLSDVFGRNERILTSAAPESDRHTWAQIDGSSTSSEDL